MDHSFAEAIYDSLQGNLVIPVPGGENAFAPGSQCERDYAGILEAYGRLCQRLGKKEEDPDVEIIINNFLSIQKTLCIKMFACGVKFANTMEKTEKND